MLHQMFYLEMAWENFQHAYLTLTPHPTPQQSSKLLQIGNVPAIIKDAFCCIYACMYNVQVHFSGRFSFININFQSAKGDNPKRPPPLSDLVPFKIMKHGTPPFG